MQLAIRTGLAMLACAGVAACGGGGGGSEEPATGHLRLSITDAPVDDAMSVVVQFSGVAFKQQGSAPEIIESISPRQIDLLEYQEGRAALLLDDIVLPAGSYEWIRLIVDNVPNVRDSYLVQMTGEECELRVPSGAESGLKLNRGFTLSADGSTALTIDFDLRKSIHAPPGQQGGAPDCSQAYLMRPTLRIVDDANVGAVAGTVDSALVMDDCLPKVYVFQGHDVVADDIDDAGTPDVDPYLVAEVGIENGSTAYDYRAAFLPPGNYTVAFTCSDDDPAAEDELAFLTPRAVTVQANLIATADFSPPPPEL